MAVESVKTAADIYQMVDGEVLEINEDLADDSSIMNSDAEGKGWIMKVKLSNKDQLGELLDESAYKEILWSNIQIRSKGISKDLVKMKL